MSSCLFLAQETDALHLSLENLIGRFPLLCVADLHGQSSSKSVFVLMNTERSSEKQHKVAKVLGMAEFERR